MFDMEAALSVTTLPGLQKLTSSETSPVG
jgi:hypothetical protein